MQSLFPHSGGILIPYYHYGPKKQEEPSVTKLIRKSGEKPRRITGGV